MRMLRTRRQGGYTMVETLCTIGTIALLLAMGFGLCRGMRAAARVSCAESRLRQISTGMELYFRKYNSYPPQGSDLTVELEPFIDDPEVFENPMVEENTPGETVNELYVQPNLDELDSPDHYVTAMINENGGTVVILKTGHDVERRDDLRYIPEDLTDALTAILDPPYGISGGDPDHTPTPTPTPDPTPEPTEEPTQPPADTSMSGLININPRNNKDYEFEIQTPAGIITRDDLHASNGKIDYEGAASWIRFFPKGNGNQNWLTWGGQPYAVRNGRQYIISGAMTVHLYNDKHGNGKAMGRWWIEITASQAAIVECYGPSCTP